MSDTATPDIGAGVFTHYFNRMAGNAIEPPAMRTATAALAA